MTDYLCQASQAPQPLLLSCVKTWKFTENLGVCKWKCSLLGDRFPHHSSKIVFPYYPLSLHFFLSVRAVVTCTYLVPCLSPLSITIFSMRNPPRKIPTRYFNLFFFHTKSWYIFSICSTFQSPLASAQGPHVAGGCRTGRGGRTA